jgi:hypothetical protein
MVIGPLKSCARWLLTASLVALLAACSTSDGGPNANNGSTDDPIVGVIPGEPGWQPRTPPAAGLCVGVNPGEAAFELSRSIAQAAAEALAREQALADARDAQGSGDTAEDDAGIADTTDTTDDGARDTAAVEEPPPALPVEPCTPDYLDAEECIGYEAPSFAAYDFQPQSCGFGATYGLDAFKGRVTFVALFASW